MSRLTNLNRLLPLVAIGTVADCQSIIDPVNRLLVSAGIQIIQKNIHQIEGLNQLLSQSGVNEKIKQGYKITSQDLGFLLSPILNSSGRISHARLSIATMIADNDDQNNRPNCSKIVQENEKYLNQSTSNLAKNLIQTNQDRKQMVKEILSQVNQEAKQQYDNGQQILWLEGKWNKGIIGLLASRLVNEYNLPVVVISNNDEE